MQLNETPENSSTLPVDLLIVPKQALVGGKKEWLIDAKELYNFLKPEKHFQEWLEDLIEFYGYVEDSDFIRTEEEGDLLLTLPTAREISMTVPTQAGRKARFYFVAFGNKHPQEPIAEDEEEIEDNLTVSEADYVAEETEDESDESDEEVNEEEEEPIEVLDLVEASKELGVGVQFLYQYMKDIGWLISENNEPRLWTIRKGYMMYDLEQATEEGTPGLLTLDGLDILQEKLVRLGVITIVPE